MKKNLFLMLFLAVFIFSDVCQAQSPNISAGILEYKKGNYEETIKLLGQEDANNFEANYYLGMSYLNLKRYKDARDYLRNARVINPNFKGLNYDLGFAYFNLYRFENAYELLKEALKENPSNAWGNYYAGMSLYKQLNYKEAADYFLKAGDIKNEIKANCYYYAGMCYLKTGEAQKALDKFGYVKDNTDSKTLKTYSQKWIEEIKAGKGKEKPYSISFTLGYKYDDNVILEPVDYNIASNKADYSLEGCFSFKYDLFNQGDKKFGIRYNHYQTLYNRLNEYNLINSFLDLYGEYKTGDWTFNMSLVPTFYWIDYERYLTRLRVESDISYKFSEEFMLKTTIGYSHDDDVKDDRKDADVNDISMNAYYSFLDKKIFLIAGLGHEINKTKESYYSFGKTNIRFGITAKLPYEIDLNFNNKYYWISYDKKEYGYNDFRKDDKYYMSLSLNRKVYYDWLSASLGYGFTNNRSNINDYEYRKNTVLLSFTVKY